MNPTGRFKAVTPSDSLTLTWNGAQAATQFITCAVAGNIVVKDSADNSVTLAILAGFAYPIITNKILSTSTTATGICAYF